MPAGVLEYIKKNMSEVRVIQPRKPASTILLWGEETDHCQGARQDRRSAETPIQGCHCRVNRQKVRTYPYHH